MTAGERSAMWFDGAPVRAQRPGHLRRVRPPHPPRWTPPPRAMTLHVLGRGRRDRPYNSFHATGQTRKAIRTVTEDAVADIARLGDGTHSLDPEQLTVDLWDIEAGLGLQAITPPAVRRRPG